MLISVVQLGAFASERIPIDIYKHVSSILGISLSKDGDAYATIKMVGDQPTISIFPTPARKQFLEQSYTFPKSLLSQARWIDNERLIVSFTEIVKTKRGRNKEFIRHWALIDRNENTQRTILSYEVNLLVANGQDDLLSSLPADHDHILLAYPDRRGFYPAINKVNINTGAVELLVKAQEPITKWLVDKDGMPIFGYGNGDEKSTLLVRDNETGKLTNISDKPLFKSGYFSPLTQGLTENSMYVSSSVGQGRRKIFHYDYRNHTILSKVFEHDRVDVENILYSRKNDKILAALYVDDRLEYKFFDEEFESRFEKINEHLPGRINHLVSVNELENLYIISSSGEYSPKQYYLYDQEKDEVELLVDNGSGLENYQLSPVEPITYFSRDGLEIHSYLTRPVNGEDKPLPAIILPHGGPWVRDTLGFNDWAQFFANRGYVVLQPNFRGSTGYGTNFTNISRGEWGERMQNDLTDGVRWLISQNIAQADNICIAGGSYGGYAALMGVVKDPDLYKCAISFAPVTDLDTYFKTYRRSPQKESIVMQVRGDKPKSFLKTSSPSKQASQIKVPVLLIHGDSDIRVDINHSELMVKSMKRANTDYNYIVLKSGSHFLLQQEHKQILYENMEKFLSDHLGGQ